jgi:hypothetical protein
LTRLQAYVYHEAGLLSSKVLEQWLLGTKHRDKRINSVTAEQDGAEDLLLRFSFDGSVAEAKTVLRPAIDALGVQLELSGHSAKQIFAAELEKPATKKARAVVEELEVPAFDAEAGLEFLEAA